MSAPFDPTNYDISVYPLGQAGPLVSDGWITWASGSPVTVSFVSGLAVKALWFPNPLGQMSFYYGTSATGTPFYVSPGNVAELVLVPNDAPQVTIAGPGGTVYLYASTFPYTPFAAGTPPNLDLQVVAPIVNTGTPSAPIIGLDTPLAVSFGGSGSTDPSLIAGAHVTITGSWPNQQIDVSEGAGGVQTVAVSAPITLSGTAQNPVIGLDTPLPLADGGTATTDPYLEGTNGIVVNGADSVEDQTFQWVLSLAAFLIDNGGATVDGPATFKENGGITVLKTGAKQITFDTTALVPVTGGITSTDGSIVVTPHVGSQSVDLSAQSGSVSVYDPNGTQLNQPKIVRSASGTYSVSYSVSGGTVTIGSTTITFTGGAVFATATYTIIISIVSVSGGANPVVVLEPSGIGTGGFTVSGYGMNPGATGTGTIVFDILCIGH